jgi:hypothetical protein
MTKEHRAEIETTGGALTKTVGDLVESDREPSPKERRQMIGGFFGIVLGGFRDLNRIADSLEKIANRP